MYKKSVLFGVDGRWYAPTKYVLATFIFLFRAKLVRTLAESGYDK